MSDLYKNKYRIKSARRDGYDYTADGWYFVTICTKCKHPYFGDVVDSEMVLLEIGKIADKFWKEIPKHFNDVKIDNFIIMPNHVHGIIVIDRGKTSSVETPIHRVSDNRQNINKRDAINGQDIVNKRDAMNGRNVVNKRDAMNGRLYGGVTGVYNPMGRKSLFEIVRWYKGRCSFEINKTNPVENFMWQARFHDRIIRNNNELNKTRQYIINNPEKWEFDENNPDNNMQ